MEILSFPALLAWIFLNPEFYFQNMSPGGNQCNQKPKVIDTLI